ncbi:MAG: FtsX-like permease family protein [bacterium]
MVLILKIAFLNVLRNRRRSVITILAIVFGSVSLIVFGGFVESMYDGLRESMIRSQLGHLQVYKKGFSEFGSVEPEKYLLSAETTRQIMDIVETHPGVEIVTSRLNFSGLLSNGKSSVGVFGVGMDADKEALMNSSVKIVAGDDLFTEDLESALIGEGLAQSLSIRVGDWMTLLASTADGAVNAVDIKVAGIISTGMKEIDDRVIRANRLHIQNLMVTDRLTRVIVLLEKTETTTAAKLSLEKAFAAHHLDVEIRTWSDLAGYYHKVVRMFTSVFGFIKIIVVVIVILGIANTMMMAVMERTSEIGTIRALGNTRSEILALFLSEAVFLGIMGGLCGIMLGVLAARGITAADLMMPPPPGGTEGFPIRIMVVPDLLWESIGLGILASVISSIYPSLKASRLKIVDALRFV